MTEVVKRSHKKKVPVVVPEPVNVIEDENEFTWNPNGNGHVEEPDENIFDLDAEDEPDFEQEGDGEPEGWGDSTGIEVDESAGEESQEYIRKPTRKQVQASDILARAMKITAKAPKMKAQKMEKPAKEEKEVHFAPVDYILPEEFKFDTYEQGLAKLWELSRRDSTDRWTMGWMLLGIPTKYGKRTIEELANEVGVPKATLTMYRWVARAFSPENVVTFPILTFAHYKVVAKLALTNKEAAMDILEKAAIGDMGRSWSVDKLTAFMKQTPQEKLKPMSVPGGELQVIGNMDDLALVDIPEGHVAFVYITDSGNAEDWKKAANDCGLLGTISKANFRVVNDD